MRLLFDENLPPRLCKPWQTGFEELQHVRDIGLKGADDSAIWSYARQHDLGIVTRDRDYSDRAVVVGAPPKVVWLKVRNGSTHDYASLVHAPRDALHEFVQDSTADYLVLPPGLRL